MRRYEDVMPKRQINFIKRKANIQLSTRELVKMFNAKFGTSISYDLMKYMRRRLAPGTRYDREFQFAALRERFQAALGTEYRQSEGYTLVKVAGKKRWLYKHRLIWESHYGPCPEDHMVCFLDGDITNFNLDNLMAINRQMDAFMRVKKISRLVLKDLGAAKTIAAMHQINRQRNKMERARKGTKHQFQNLPPLYLPVGRPGFAY